MLPGGRKCIHNHPGASKTPPEAIFERMKLFENTFQKPKANSHHEIHGF